MENSNTIILMIDFTEQEVKEKGQILDNYISACSKMTPSNVSSFSKNYAANFGKKLGTVYQNCICTETTIGTFKTTLFFKKKISKRSVENILKKMVNGGHIQFAFQSLGEVMFYVTPILSISSDYLLREPITGINFRDDWKQAS